MTGCKASASGASAHYVVRYRFRRRHRWLTIGRHDAPWKAEPARREVLRILNVVKVERRDPAEDRDRMRAEPDLANVIERYLLEHSAAHHAPATHSAAKAYLRKAAQEAIGKRPISSIVTADIAKLHHAGKVKGTDANRMVAHLSHLFTLAERWGLRPQNSNPCRGIARYKENRRERFLSTEEMGWLGAALLAAERGDTEWRAIANEDNGPLGHKAGDS